MFISDADIKLAVHRYCTRVYSADLAADPPFVFSEKHIQTMNKMLGSADRRRSARRIIRHAAAVVAAALVIFIISCFAFPKVWAAVRSWYINIVSPDRLVYEFEHVENDHAFLVVRPDDLPDGFVLTHIDEGDGYSEQIYRNSGTEDYLKFSYHWATVKELKQLEKLEKKYGLISIYMGQKAVLYTEKGLSKLALYDKYSRISYWAESNLSEAELVSMFDETIEMHPPIYEPTWLPEGYEVDEIYIDKGTVEIIYINDDTNDFIVINCGDLGETDRAFVIGDGVGDPINVVIDGIDATIYCHNQEDYVGTDIVMIDETTNLVFTIETGCIYPNLVIKIAESLEVVDTISRYMP